MDFNPLSKDWIPYNKKPFKTVILKYGAQSWSRFFIAGEGA